MTHGVHHDRDASGRMNYEVLDRTDVNGIFLPEVDRVGLECVDLKSVDPNGDDRIIANATDSDHVPEGAVPFPEELVDLRAIDQLVAGHRVIGGEPIVLDVIVSLRTDTAFVPFFV